MVDTFTNDIAPRQSKEEREVVAELEIVVSDYGSPKRGAKRKLRGAEAQRVINHLIEMDLWTAEVANAADVIDVALRCRHFLRCGDSPETVIPFLESEMPWLAGTDWAKAWQLVNARYALDALEFGMEN